MVFDRSLVKETPCIHKDFSWSRSNLVYGEDRKKMQRRDFWLTRQEWETLDKESHSCLVEAGEVKIKLEPVFIKHSEKNPDWVLIEFPFYYTYPMYLCHGGWAYTTSCRRWSHPQKFKK
jgi:hypothetical protein